MYESLLIKAEQLGLRIVEMPMPITMKGLYSDGVAWINKNIKLTADRACTLAEEIGHHETTEGDILDQSDLENRKQERKARTWAYMELIPLIKIVQASKEGIYNRYELSEFLGVTEDFLTDALKRYQEIYGNRIMYNNYIITFDPLGVYEMAR